MRNQYSITSRAGQFMGVYKGRNRAEALCNMHRDAGYECRVNKDGTYVTFDSDEDARLCGYLGDWDVVEFADHSRNIMCSGYR